MVCVCERERDGGHRTRRVAGVTVRRSMPSGDQSPCYPNLQADFGENCLHLIYAGEGEGKELGRNTREKHTHTHINTHSCISLCLLSSSSSSSPSSSIYSFLLLLLLLLLLLVSLLSVSKRLVVIRDGSECSWCGGPWTIPYQFRPGSVLTRPAGGTSQR